MITAPNWSRIALDLRRRYGTDEAVVDELHKIGGELDRANFAKLCIGKYKEPRSYVTCRALLRLHEGMETER